MGYNLAMEFVPQDIPDVLIIRTHIFQDRRGFFTETYQKKAFAEAGITAEFVQDNYSGSYRGVLRGLHYQVRQAQGKLIRVLSGEVFDVAVDLRRSSPTFGRWVGMCLSGRSASSQGYQQLWIPPGFAHGFYVLSDFAEILYKVTDFYAPQWERTLLWNDPQLGIEWPLLADSPPMLSEKDAVGRLFSEAEVFD